MQRVVKTRKYTRRRIARIGLALSIFSAATWLIPGAPIAVVTSPEGPPLWWWAGWGCSTVVLLGLSCILFYMPKEWHKNWWHNQKEFWGEIADNFKKWLDQD